MSRLKPAGAGFSCKNQYRALRIIPAALIVITSLLATGCQDQRAEVTISVLDEITNSPVANALITFDGQTVSLKEDGTFVIKGVEKGSYTISVTAPGYEETKVTIEVSSGKTVHVPVQISPLATSTEIGSESATLKGPKGATLFIAPHTYGERERIKIQVKLVPDESASYPLEGLISPVYEIQGDQDKYFRQPATLTIPLNDKVQIDSASYVLAVHWNGVRWTPLGGKLDAGGRTVQVKISHFGKFAVKKLRSQPKSITTEHFRIVALDAPSYSLEDLAESLENAWVLITQDLGFVISTENGEPITVWVLEQEDPSSNETKTLDDLYQYLDHSISFNTNIKSSSLNVQTAYELSHLLLRSYVQPQDREDLYRILWWIEVTASWISAKALESKEFEIYKQLYQLQGAQALENPLDSKGNDANFMAISLVRYIEDKFGTSTVRTIWERLTSDISILEAIDSVLRDRGSSLTEVYLDLVGEYLYPRSEWMRKVVSSSGQGENLYPEVRVTSGRGLKEFHFLPFSSRVLQLVPKEGVQGTLVLDFESVEASQGLKARILLENASGRIFTENLTRFGEFRIPNFGQEVLKASLLAVNTSAKDTYLNLTYQLREEGPEEEPLEEMLPPVAVIKVSETRGVVPLVVEFDASESKDLAGEMLEYLWDFGDGETATGVRVTHTYEQPGKYTVLLTVMNPSNLKQKVSVEIEALAATEDIQPIVPKVEYSEKFDFEIFTQNGDRMLLSEYLDKFHKGKFVLLAVGDLGKQDPLKDIRESFKGLIEPLDMIRVHYLDNTLTMEEIPSFIQKAQLSKGMENIFTASGAMSELIGMARSSQGFGQRFLARDSKEGKSGLLLIGIDRRILHVFYPHEILERDKLLKEWNFIRALQDNFPASDVLTTPTEFYFVLYSNWSLISSKTRVYNSLSTVDILLRYNHPFFVKEYLRNEFTRQRLQDSYDSLENKVHQRFAKFRERIAGAGHKYYIMPGGFVDVGTYDFSKKGFPIQLSCKKLGISLDTPYAVLSEDLLRNSYEIASYPVMLGAELRLPPLGPTIYYINIIAETCNLFLEMDPEKAEEFVNSGRGLYPYLIWRPEAVYHKKVLAKSVPVALIGRLEGLVLLDEKRNLISIFKL